MDQETMTLQGLALVTGINGFLIALFLAFLYLRSGKVPQTQKRTSEANQPPGPKPWPVIGNLGTLVAQDLPPPAVFAKLSKEFGPLMFMRFGSQPAIVVSSPEMAREILQTHDEVFASRPKSSPNVELLYKYQSIGNPVYGRSFQSWRKLFTLDISTLNKIHQFQGFRKEELVATMQSLVEKSEGGKVVHFDFDLQNQIDQDIKAHTEEICEDETNGSLRDAAETGMAMVSHTVDWAFSELLRNPRIIEKAQQELDSVIGSDRLVAEEDIPNLPYLQSIAKEVFRLHPVVPLLVPRESTRACEVDGYHIPAKTEVFVNVWAIGRDTSIWGNDALDFLPERFMPPQDAHSMDVRGQSFELLPFGSGRRGCPGMKQGAALVQYVLALMLHSCDWTLPAGQPPASVDMSELYGVSIARATPLQATVTPRLPRRVIFPAGRRSTR